MVLLCYDQESVQHLVRAFDKHSELKSKINSVVKGVGDLTSYMAEFHAEKFQVFCRDSSSLVILAL